MAEPIQKKPKIIVKFPIARPWGPGGAMDPSDLTKPQDFEACCTRILHEFCYHFRGYAWSEKGHALAEYAINSGKIAPRKPVDALTLQAYTKTAQLAPEWVAWSAMRIMETIGQGGTRPPVYAGIAYLVAREIGHRRPLDEILAALPAATNREAVLPWVQQAVYVLTEYEDKTYACAVYNKEGERVSGFYPGEYKAWSEAIKNVKCKAFDQMFNYGYVSAWRDVPNDWVGPRSEVDIGIVP